MQQKEMKQGKNVHCICSCDECSKSSPCNIRGVWSHLGDMTTLFLYAVFYHMHVMHVVEI